MKDWPCIYTNTPAWEAASTAASTRPRRTEKTRSKSNSHAIYSFSQAAILYEKNEAEDRMWNSVKMPDDARNVSLFGYT